jgi:hypothetical protein
MSQSENNLRQHLNSNIHKPRSVMCPLDRRKAGFVSNSALVAHVEANICPSGIGREELDVDSHSSTAYFTTGTSTGGWIYCRPDNECGSTFRFLSATLRHIEDKGCEAMQVAYIRKAIQRLIRHLPDIEVDD